MSKFNEKSINRNTPLGTKIMRINDDYFECKVGEIRTLRAFSSFNNGDLAILVENSIIKYRPINFSIVEEN